MEGETLVVRKVDRKIYVRFKEEAVKERKNLGNAISEAMEYWIINKKAAKKPNPKNLLKLNGIIKTKNKVRWSEEIDTILYGAP